MIEINEFLFIGIIMGMTIVGIILGASVTRDYRKELEKEYNKKHEEMYNTIRNETKNEWSKGWDAAYSRVGKTQKAYYLWFREHGYDTDDIDAWLNKYLGNNK